MRNHLLTRWGSSLEKQDKGPLLTYGAVLILSDMITDKGCGEWLVCVCVCVWVCEVYV